MIREFAVALGLIILIAVPSAVAATTPDTAPVWTATLAEENVSHGNPIQIIVGGPVNGTFSVAVEAQPFNYTVPIFSGDYTIPKQNNTTFNSLLVSYPTSTLYGGYLILVTNISYNINIATDIVYVVPDVTGITNNLQTIWQDLNITTARELALLGVETQQEQQIEELFWVIVGETAIFIVVFTLSRPGLANRRWGRKILQALHDAFFEPTMQEAREGVTGPRNIPAPDPRSIFFSKLFPDCDTCQIPQWEERIQRHLRQDHRIPNPKLGEHYEVKPSAVRLVLQKRATIEPSQKKLQDAVDHLRLDFSDLEGGGSN